MPETEPGTKFDYFAQPQAKDYFDKLLLHNTEQLLRKYSLCPPDDVSGERGKTARKWDHPGTEGELTYARVMQDRKVAYVHLFKEPRAPLGRGNGNSEGGDVIKFRTSYHRPIGPAVYFLPWNSAGGIVRLTIRPKGTANPDPDIFFTAAINGCSIFIQGNPDSPSIYHAGGDTRKDDPTEAAAFWRDAFQKEVLDKGHVNRGAFKAEVNKTHYVKTPGVQGGTTTRRALRYENLLKQTYDRPGKFTVSMVNPWGCVMGIRTGNNWKFYLQENGTVICQVINGENRNTFAYARPMTLREIHPGAGVVDMNWNIPLRIT